MQNSSLPPRLPIPPLEQTLDRFVEGISPILTDRQIQQTKEATKAFKKQGGTVLQERLLKYADEQAEQHKSWLTELKLGEYMHDTRPVSITNNASLQIDYPPQQTQASDTEQFDDNIQRAASLIQRLARLHVDYINDNIEPPVDGRGQIISIYNWRLLTGAVRLPQADGDVYYYAPKESANRYISIMYKGHQIVLQVTDADGHVYSVQDYADALQSILDDNIDNSTDLTKPPTLPFSDLSALGSIKTHQHLTSLTQDAHNQNVYQAIKDSLFCLSLYHSDSSLPDDKREVEQIRTQTFIPGNAWQYKPNTYQFDLNSDFLAIHFEHSEIDGAALRYMFNYAFALKLDDASLADGKPDIKVLDWQTDHDIAEQIKTDVAQLKNQAEQLRVSQCNADYTAINTKVSHDAIMQFAFIYAQLKVFGKVRNTYEAVDTSQYMAGRTEALRPNSTEAITFAKALIDGEATMEHLQDALAAHKQRVIASKTGQAFDRHLSGLKYMIKEDDNDDSMTQFYNSSGYKTLTGGDFLSTSSMGNQSPIKRILFAPVMQGGFGVNYSISPTEYDFVFFGDKDSSQYVDDMCAACVEAVEKIAKLTQQ